MQFIADSASMDYLVLKNFALALSHPISNTIQRNGLTRSSGAQQAYWICSSLASE